LSTVPKGKLPFFFLLGNSP